MTMIYISWYHLNLGSLFHHHPECVYQDGQNGKTQHNLKSETFSQTDRKCHQHTKIQEKFSAAG